MNQTPVLEPGDTVKGRFYVECAIETGGFCRVYRARERSLGRDVAIKVLAPDAARRARTPDAVEERFRREAKLLARLQHPSTLTIHEHGELEDGSPYMALEFVDGTPLHRIETPVAPRRVVDLMRQALGSLAEAHDFGVLHRDIKPSNLIVQSATGDCDRLKVIDFGAAKPLRFSRGQTLRPLTADANILGTPEYVAPEFASDDPPSPASDIYSLGIVAHELLTGERPVPDAPPMDVLDFHVDESTEIDLPSAPRIPDSLRRVVDRMTARSLDARYDDADTLRDELADLLPFGRGYAETTALYCPGAPGPPPPESDERNGAVSVEFEAPAAGPRSGSNPRTGGRAGPPVSDDVTPRARPSPELVSATDGGARHQTDVPGGPSPSSTATPTAVTRHDTSEAGAAPDTPVIRADDDILSDGAPMTCDVDRSSRDTPTPARRLLALLRRLAQNRSRLALALSGTGVFLVAVAVVWLVL